MKNVLLCLVLSALVMNGCGSSNGGPPPPPPPPPPPTITSVVVSPATVSLVSGDTWQFSVQVSGTGNFSSAVTWSASGGTITASGLYTAPSVSASTNFAVTATSVQYPTKSGSAAVNVEVGVAPTVTISPLSANVPFGGSQNYTCLATGNPAPAITWNLSGAGSLAVAGNTAIYSVPNVLPASFLATITCTATNSSGQASASAAANLVAQIQSVSQNNFFCPRECNAPVTLAMTGVFAGVTGFTSSDGNLLSLGFIDPTHVKIVFKFDTPHFRDGTFTVCAVEPAPGGGSVCANFAFSGNLDALPISSANGFEFDYGSGFGYKFDLQTGQSFPPFIAGGYGHAFDATTSYIAGTGSTTLVALRSSNGAFVTTWTNGEFTMGVAAKSGQACFSQDIAGWLSSVDLTQTNPPGPITSNKAIGSIPISVATTTLPNDGLVCSVYTAGDTTLSVADVPAMQLKRFIPLAGLTPASQLPQFQGGWQLVAFDSGPAVGKAVLLSRFDKQLIRADLATGQEVGRVTLDGSQSLAAANNADGSVVVSIGDIDADSSRFVRVAIDGTVTPLLATTNFFVTRLAVSPDGTKIFAGNAKLGKFQILPNN